MQEASSFTAIHNLLAMRDNSAWALYWKESGENEEDVLNVYVYYIEALITKIKISQVKRVFIIHKDRAFFLAAFLAALHAGVPVVLPPSDALGLLKDLLGPEDGMLTNLEELSQLTSNFISMDDIEIHPHIFLKFTPFNPSKALVTFYTSGSTGKPKAVQKILTQLAEEVATLEKLWGSKDSAGTFLSTVPHHHIYGLLFSLLWPVCGGYPLRRETLSYWEEVVRFCAKGATIISSPSHLGRFPFFKDEGDELNIRNVFSSGGILSFEASQATQKFLGLCPVEVYGSTETGGIAYRQQNTGDDTWTKFKDVDLSLGENNRLCVKSPYLSSDKSYQTEDLVSLESDHSFRLWGRADRIVKIEGKRVCLVEIEQRLKGLEHIQEAIVIPLATQKRDELGSIMVLSIQGQERLSAIGKVQFIREIRKSLSLYCDAVALPRKWRFVSELPISGHGKHPRDLLLSYFGGTE